MARQHGGGYVIPWASAARRLARGVLLHLWGGPIRDNERLTGFLHLTPEQTVRDFIQHNVRRCSESRDGAEVTQLDASSEVRSWSSQ